MTLGTRLRRRREELGLSQRELARLIDTRQATISDLERGTLKNPGIDIIRRLGRALGVTSDYLIGMYEENESELQPAGLAMVGA
jgi:transcriptional regulator with XRE-family HTH domain